MDTIPSASTDNQQRANNPLPNYLRDPNLDSARPKGLLATWYRYTSPPEPSTTATYKERDTYRRGQLASTIMLALQFILLIIIPIGLFGPNKQIFITAIFLTIIIIISALFNQRGKVNIAGLIMSLSLNLGICLSILRTPHGLTPDSIALFDLLVFSELFVASLLPINWVWASALFNIVFSVYELTYAPRTPLFQTVMSTSYYAVVSRPIQLHLLVTVVLFLWVVNANRAIKRADRAEEIAKLQRDLAQQSKVIKGQKQLLDRSIDQIVETLMRWSNGATNARIPLNNENALWQVAGSINNLLSRVQRSRQESAAFQANNEAMRRFYEARERSDGGPILDWTRTNTPIDTLVMQHNTQIRQSGSLNRPSGHNVSQSSSTMPPFTDNAPYFQSSNERREQ